MMIRERERKCRRELEEYISERNHRVMRRNYGLKVIKGQCDACYVIGD